MKKDNRTAEDRLAAALVPVEEQPYQVPGNWCWCHLSAALSTSKEKTEEFTNPSVKYIGLEHMGKDEGIVSFGSAEGIKSLKNVFYAGQILYGKLRPYLNKHDIASFSGICSTDILVFNTLATTMPEYVNYYLNLDYFIQYVVGNSKGINLPRVSETIVLDASYPLPPLAEQRRIVDHITSLFAQLDQAKEEAEAIIDGYEDRKAAILHRAFTGELTEEWREMTGVSRNEWQTVSMQDICEKIVCGKTPTGNISSQGDIPFLKVYNIVNDEIDFESNPQFIPLDVHNGRLGSSILKPNDVVMNIVGPPLRKIAVIPNTYPEWNMNQAIVRFRAKEKITYRYLFYSLINPATLEEIIQSTRGVVGQANISVSQSRNLTIELPPIAEQHEIVRRLDILLTHEAEVKSAAEETIANISTLRQSILARAFRGELGTNDPNDEPAIELLKRVLEGA